MIDNCLYSLNKQLRFLVGFEGDLFGDLAKN